MTNYSIQTHSTQPQDIFEPPFAALHYFVCEHIAGEEKCYSSVVINTDETQEFSDLDALKAAFFKRARNFANSKNMIGIGHNEIDASSASVNTMSAMIIGALFDFVSQAAHANKKLESAFETAFAQKVAFKCSDKVVREIPLSQLVEAHKEAVRRITEQYTGESAKENGDVFEENENETETEAENEAIQGAQESEETQDAQSQETESDLPLNEEQQTEVDSASEAESSKEGE